MISLKNVFRIIGVVVVVGLLATSYFYHNAYQRERADRLRLSENQEVLLGERDFYKTEYGTSVSTNKELNLSLKEYKSLYAASAKEIRDLNLKVKRLLAQVDGTITTSIDTTVVSQDTTIFVGGVTIPAVVFRWKDEWTSIAGVATKDSTTLSYRSKDSITTRIFYTPKRFLFWDVGVKSMYQVMTNKNPNNEISYSRFITLEKLNKVKD